MIQLDLAASEQEILAQLLVEALSDLRMEIAGTDSKDFREMLKVRKRVIHTTLDALGRPARRQPEPLRAR